MEKVKESHLGPFNLVSPNNERIYSLTEFYIRIRPVAFSTLKIHGRLGRKSHFEACLVQYIHANQRFSQALNNRVK